MNRKQNISFSVLLATACILFFSCENKKGKNYDLKFDSIRIERTAHLLGQDTNPACQVSILFTHIAQSSNPLLKDSLNSLFIAQTFDGEVSSNKAREAVEDYIARYIMNYRTELDSVYLEDRKTNPEAETVQAWYSYTKDVRTEIQNLQGDLLTYRIYFEEYTGGAHGTYYTSFLNIDLNTLTTLSLDDLFVGDYQEPLAKLICLQLMAQNNVSTREELENLGYGVTGDILPIENFYLDDKGITFFYNVYDISPYALGTSSVTIPYSHMEALLSEHPILKQLKK